MKKYILNSFVRLILLLFAVSVVTFTLIEISPIDPITSYLSSSDLVSQEQREQIASYFQLEKPPVERFFNWFGDLLRLDLGESIIYRQPVIEIIGERFLSSLSLMITAWLMSGIIGTGLGFLMGANAGKTIDKVVKSICLTLSAVPTYLLGMVFLLVFSVGLGWFPIGFSSPIGMLESEITLWHRLHHLALPCLALSLSSFAGIALHTREKLIQVLKSDYVILSKTRGYSKSKILLNHGIRNILLPITTLQFASLGEIFGGSILAETVFSYPGLGNALVNAGLRGDVPLLLGITLFSAVFVFVGNLTANILYSVIDPKIRLGRSRKTLA